MAGGWTSDGSVQQQIDNSIEDAISKAREALSNGESLYHCEECGNKITQTRRQALADVRLCIICQEQVDKEQIRFSGYNRRGSKDSQLR